MPIKITDKQAEDFASFIINDIKPYINAHKEEYHEFLREHYPKEFQKYKERNFEQSCVNPFEEIKNSVDILKLAEFYGISILNGNKALCPFHDDHHPSLSFKDNKFKCFACEKSGSAIDFVANLFGISVLEASKKINEDFSLGLFNPLTKEAQKKIKKEQEQKEKNDAIVKAFENWSKVTEKWFTNIYKFLEKTRKKSGPKNFEEPSKIWTLSVNYLEIIENILEIFFSNNREEILKKYDFIEHYKNKIEKELEEV